VTNQESKPYARVGLVWAEAKGSGFSEDDIGYIAEAGVEIQPLTALTVAPYVRWTDGLDNDVIDGTFSGGALADYALNASWSVQSRAELDDDSEGGISFGARLHF